MHQTDQANGTQTNYTHDKANRLKGITHTKNNQTETLADYQYTLDANGNRIKVLVEVEKKGSGLYSCVNYYALLTFLL